MIPSVFVYSLFCSFRVFVVSEHHVCSPCQNLSGYVFRVGTVYFHFHVNNSPSAASRRKVVPVGIAYDRCALRCAVAHGEWESDALQEHLHLVVECSATDDYFIEIVAESLSHLVADALLQFLVHNRNVPQKSHGIVLQFWEHPLSDYLLYDEWHGNDD